MTPFFGAFALSSSIQLVPAVQHAKNDFSTIAKQQSTGKVNKHLSILIDESNAMYLWKAYFCVDVPAASGCGQTQVTTS